MISPVLLLVLPLLQRCDVALFRPQKVGRGISLDSAIPSVLLPLFKTGPPRPSASRALYVEGFSPCPCVKLCVSLLIRNAFNVEEKSQV